MAAYTELVRARGQFILQPGSDRPPAELLEIAKAIPSSARTGRGQAEARRGQVAAERRRRRFAGALAAMAAAVLLLVLWRGTGTRRQPDVPAELQRTLSEKLREDSYGGLLYASDLLPRARAVRGAEENERSPDLGPLEQAFAARPQSAEVAYWLIAGLLGRNQLKNAAPYLRESIQRYPRDARFHNLAAIRAYKSSDLSTSEVELRAALGIERDAATLINLAQVRREQGDAAEAAKLLAEVLHSFPHVPVADLARERSGTSAPDR